MAAAATSSVTRVVLQKATTVSLQVNPETDEWIDINDGVIVFVAFLKNASETVLPKMIKAILAAKYFRGGSIVSENKQVLLVPQATLGGRLKGKQLQYHGNINKEEGRHLYQAFVTQFEQALKEAVGDVDAVVKHGTYGNIQRMRNLSNDGPFTHVLEF
eukprot:m.15090 g.15090  ORF g.15090 m.15090 type:complete len:159 (-) comp10414_c0_seq1:151-627(-)